MADPYRANAEWAGVSKAGHSPPLIESTKAELTSLVSRASCAEVAQATDWFELERRQHWAFAGLSASGPQFSQHLASLLEARGTASCREPIPLAPSRRRVAVLLIDAALNQRDHFKGDDLDRELVAMRATLARANQTKTPVFEITMPGIFETSQALGSLRQKNWVQLAKSTQGGFFNTDLGARLKALGITDVLLMGLNEDQCVLETAAAAANLGLTLHIAADVVQSTSKVATAAPNALNMREWYEAVGSVRDRAQELDAWKLMAR